MQDLEPPEVPLDMLPQATTEYQTTVEQPKKEGLFKRMFSKKGQSESVSNAPDNVPSAPQDFSDIHLSDIDLPMMEMPTLDITGNDNITNVNSNRKNKNDLPVLPSISDQLEELKTDLSAFKTETPDMFKTKKDLSKTKSKGKLKKDQQRKISKIDESSQFDWNREIQDQEILIHDSNRFNQDVNILMKKADNHFDENISSTESDVFMSQHQNVEPALEPLNIQGLNTSLVNPLPEASQQMPIIDVEQQKAFAKISGNHQKLRSMLQKYLKNQKLFSDKAKIMELFKQYDDSIESNIEDKEMELTKRKQELERYENHLKQQEKDIKNMHSYMKGLDNKLKDRENHINNIISNAVEKDLSRRLKTEKTLLKEGLYETTKLNTDLKKKVKIIEDDRTRFEREHQRMSDMERKKLTELQTLYEKKLAELEVEKKTFDGERKAFEAKRIYVLGLIRQGDTVAKELDDIKKIKTYVDESKRFVEKELTEDKELKQAIAAGEQSLAKEKENLDNMIFSRYIDSKLKSIKPEYLEKRQDWKAELHSNPLYAQISDCRKLLLQRNINEAKSLYNNIRKSYEQVQTTKKEKEALYNAIRELYNDIQLKIVEAQLHTR